ncbi:hypothetical protein CU044_6042 [Streptomyces sp. L-9-10]|nr:hypothetical protein [Streptomyces sp. L-9-10]RYJ22271.1 hypothetical protein CU044_6042 [Streptomyces sp. L-9-10]
MPARTSSSETRLSTGKLTIERVYLITSLSVFDATCTELATYIRGH